MESNTIPLLGLPKETKPLATAAINATTTSKLNTRVLGIVLKKNDTNSLHQLVLEVFFDVIPSRVHSNI